MSSVSPFYVYTSGDLDMFQSALNSVAMVFSPTSGLFVSGGALGLGSLPAFGLLISLGVMLLQQASGGGGKNGPTWLGQMILLIMCFYTMFVPKFTVHLEDIYTSKIAKVDNVPLGIALPTALISGITREVGDVLQTVYTAADQRYVSTAGFMSPIKLMGALRNLELQAAKMYPYYSKNLASFARSCTTVTGNDVVSLQAGAGNIVDTITRPGWYVPDYAVTYYYPDATGSGDTQTLIGCEEMANFLKDPAIPPTGLPATTEKPNIVECGGGMTGVAPSPVQYNIDGLRVNCLPGSPDAAVVDSALMQNFTKSKSPGFGSAAHVLSAMTKTVAQKIDQPARDYLVNVTLNPFVLAGLNCRSKSIVGAGGADKTADECLTFSVARSQLAADSAAQATYFINMMDTSMNMFQFIFICMMPIVAVVAIMKGPAGLKLLGAYLFFGVWASSWRIGAIVIDYFMQIATYDVINNTFRWQAMTSADHLIFLQSIQDKITVASTMMSSVPVLMMTLLSGSVYGLASLAQQGVGSFASKYDETLGSKSLAKSAPLSSLAAATMQEQRLAFDANGNVIDSMASDFGDMTMTRSQSKTATETKKLTDTATQQINNGVARMAQNILSHGRGAENADAMKDALTQAGLQKQAAAITDAENIDKSNILSDSEKEELKETNKWIVDTGFSGNDLAEAWKARKAALGKEAGVDPSKLGQHTVPRGAITKEAADALEKLHKMDKAEKSMAGSLKGFGGKLTTAMGKVASAAGATPAAQAAAQGLAGRLLPKVAGVVAGGVGSVVASPVGGIMVGLAAEAAVTALLNGKATAQHSEDSVHARAKMEEERQSRGSQNSVQKTESVENSTGDSLSFEQLRKFGDTFSSSDSNASSQKWGVDLTKAATAATEAANQISTGNAASTTYTIKPDNVRAALFPPGGAANHDLINGFSDLLSRTGGDGTKELDKAMSIANSKYHHFDDGSRRAMATVYALDSLQKQGVLSQDQSAVFDQLKSQIGGQQVDVGGAVYGVNQLRFDELNSKISESDIEEIVKGARGLQPSHAISTVMAGLKRRFPNITEPEAMALLQKRSAEGYRLVTNHQQTGRLTLGPK